MLIRRQDLMVLFFHCIGYATIKNIFLRLIQKPVTRFVVFHDVPFESIDNFKKNLIFLKKSTNVISIADFFAGKLSVREINVVITFDDGFKNWIYYAVPLLKELCMPAIFFISSGFVGLSKADEVKFVSKKLHLNSLPYNNVSISLTVEDVRRIAEDGFLIGGHTVNHFNLAGLTDNEQLKQEIEKDKMQLEKIIGRRIDFFAYPSGSYKNPEIDLTGILRNSGYMGAVTTESGLNTQETCPYHLHRELTDALMPGLVFKARVYGNYDGVRAFKEKIFSRR